MLKQAKPEHLEGGLRATLKPTWRCIKLIHWWWQDFLAGPHSLSSLVSSEKFSQLELGTPSVQLWLVHHNIKDIAMGSRRDEVVCGAPGSQYFRKIDVDVQLLFFWGRGEALKSFHFLFWGILKSENQNFKTFQMKSRLRSLFSPYLDWLRC